MSIFDELANMFSGNDDKNLEREKIQKNIQLSFLEQESKNNGFANFDITKNIVDSANNIAFENMTSGQIRELATKKGNNGLSIAEQDIVMADKLENLYLLKKEEEQKFVEKQKQEIEKEREELVKHYKNHLMGSSEKDKMWTKIQKENPFEISNDKFIENVKQNHKSYVYTMGENGKPTKTNYNPKSSEWRNDCNGWVSTYFNLHYKKAGMSKEERRDFFNSSDQEIKKGAIGAAGQSEFFLRKAKEDGVEPLTGPKTIKNALKNGKIEDGTVLFHSTKRGKDIDRYNDIGHIAIVIRDPKDNKMYVYEFASTKAGFKITPAEKWVDGRMGKRDLTAVPMFTDAKKKHEEILTAKLEDEITKKAQMMADNRIKEKQADFQMVMGNNGNSYNNLYRNIEGKQNIHSEENKNNENDVIDRNQYYFKEISSNNKLNSI